MMAKEQLSFGQDAKGKTGKLEDGGNGEGTLVDAAKDVTRAMLKRLILAGAPIARSMALAAYGRYKPYNPLAFWRDFDYLRLTLCSADTRQKYQKYDTIMLSTIHFSTPEEIMKARQTALLLFDVDSDELLGVWKALETVVEGSNTFILWRVVQRLPAMSKKAFHASAAGAIFPDLPPTDTSASARGEAARLVLRVLSESAALSNAVVRPSGGLPATLQPAAAGIPAADPSLASPLDALCLTAADGSVMTPTVASTLAPDASAAGEVTTQAPVETGPAVNAVKAPVVPASETTAMSSSSPSAALVTGAASLASDTKADASGLVLAVSPSPSAEACAKPPSEPAPSASVASASVTLTSKSLQDTCLAAGPTVNLATPATGVQVPTSPLAAQAQPDVGTELSTASMTYDRNRVLDNHLALPPDQKAANRDPEADGFPNSVDQPSPAAAAALPAPEPTAKVPATVPTIVFGAFDAQDDLGNTSANTADSPVATDGSRDTAIPAAVGTVAGVFTPQQPNAAPSIPVHSVPPWRPAGAALPPPAYMPPAMLMLMQLRTAHAAARPLAGPAPPGTALGAPQQPLAAPLPVAAAPVRVVTTAPASTAADATGKTAPFQFQGTQPSMAQRTSQFVPVLSAAPKPTVTQGVAPTGATPMATPSDRLACTTVVQAPAHTLGPPSTPAALLPTYTTAVRASQPQLSAVPGIAAAQPVAPQVAVRPVPAAVAATAHPLVRPAQGLPTRHSAVAGFSVAHVAPPARLTAPGTASLAASGPPVPTWATTAFPVAPPKLVEAPSCAPVEAPAEPPASKAYLLCPLCVQRTGCWFLKVCGHMGPCEQCCADLEQVQVMYPVCRCGTAVLTKETLKIRVS
ncbi:hypothetical protein Vretimale_4440 [Volvox reticuliferus]|uniref:Uncharacterized protein n=1 Tax=Volvox reticuliferus TaxID=1737510 RepID=A0A8J4FJ18_9CHLO|nr:hypothetical protein Vretifemale_3105 [Volvox reticuliferus]GIL99283.1 hypothetical protein Vretimale_4440 [Volvox reticuliferus]